MRISKAHPTLVRFVALNMRERDFAEFSAVSYADTRTDLAENLTRRFGEAPEVHVGLSDEGEPICVGGTIMARPNVVTLLFFATDAFPDIALPVTRYVRNNLFPKLMSAGVHRIEAVSIAEHEETHRWLKSLGLTQETEPMKAYGKNGEAFIQFAWSGDAGSVGA